jgi:hypothetical protein
MPVVGAELFVDSGRFITTHRGMVGVLWFVSRCYRCWCPSTVKW